MFQFHGSVGKAGRGAAVEAGGLVEGDPGGVELSWRGDGELFCVNHVIQGEEGDSRYIAY